VAKTVAGIVIALCALVIIVQAVAEWPTYAHYLSLDTLYPAEITYLTTERRDAAPDPWEYECRAAWNERASVSIGNMLYPLNRTEQ